MKLTFTFTVDEANAILKSLSQLPYEQVFQMIHSIQAQAAPQVASIEGSKQSESVDSGTPIN
jgi:hypothetical protein